MRPTWEHSAVAALTTVVTAGLLVLPGRLLGPDQTVGLALRPSPVATRQTVEAAPPPRVRAAARHHSQRPLLHTSPAQLASVVVPARPPAVVPHVVTHNAAPQHAPVSAVRSQRPSHRAPPEPTPTPAPAAPVPAPAPAPGTVPAVVTPVPDPTTTTTRVLAGSLTPVVEATPPAAADEKSGKASHNDTNGHGSGNGDNDQGNEHGNDNGHGTDSGQCEDNGHGHGSGSDKK